MLIHQQKCDYVLFNLLLKRDSEDQKLLITSMMLLTLVVDIQANRFCSLKISRLCYLVDAPENILCAVKHPLYLAINYYIIL